MYLKTGGIYLPFDNIITHHYLIQGAQNQAINLGFFKSSLKRHRSTVQITYHVKLMEIVQTNDSSQVIRSIGLLAVSFLTKNPLVKKSRSKNEMLPFQLLIT